MVVPFDFLPFQYLGLQGRMLIPRNASSEYNIFSAVNAPREEKRSF